VAFSFTGKWKEATDMSQDPSDDLAVLWGLQGFAVESIEFLRGEDAPSGKAVKLVHVLNRSGRHPCPGCGTVFSQGLFEEFERTRLRDCSLGDFETWVEMRAMRIACCGGTRVEQPPFAMPGFRMTRRFFERIAALCTRLPIRAVAEMAGLSWDTVARVDKRAIELGLGDQQLDYKSLRWIGVDEVTRTGGHVYFTIVTDLVSGRVVWIGDGKGEKGLRPFLQLLGKKGCRRIRGVISDLGYQEAIATHFPRAAHILDRFHIVQWMNEALNQLRRRLFGAAPTDELGREMKIKKWLLLSAQEKLRRKDKMLLHRLAELNEPLYHAYLLKEQLRAILRHPWKYLGSLRRRLQEWVEEARLAELKEIVKVADRLEPHIEAVVAGHRYNLPMGLVEAINSKIAMLRFQARGYRDPEYFKLKILQRCGMPDNPWAVITL
jgi:transposase